MVMETVSWKAVCTSGGISNTIYPTNADCELMMDIEGIPNVNMKYDYDGYAGAIGETLTVTARRNTVDNTIFVGKVTDKRIIKTGKQYRWREIGGLGWGKVLNERTYKGKFKELGSLAIHLVIAGLISEGELAGEDIQYTSETINRDFENELSVREALRNICSTQERDKGGLDYDFHVDHGKTLHAFRRGYYTDSLDLSTHALSYIWESSDEDIINTIEIFGGWNEIEGGDAVWTEDTVNWISSDVLVKALTASEGSYCIEGRSFTQSTIWLARTFPTPLDLEGGAIFEFDFKAVAYPNAIFAPSVPGTVDLHFRFYTDDANFYHQNIKYGQTYVKKTNYPDIIGTRQHLPVPQYYTDWAKKEVMLGDLSSEEWAEVGNPDWGTITKFRVQLDSPNFKGSTDAMYMYIDAASMTTRAKGLYGDDDSIGSFGIREPPILWNNVSRVLQSDEECYLAASLIVAAYKNPRTTIRDLNTTKNFEASLGWEYPFTDGIVTETLNVRRVRHSLKEFDFSTELELTDKWIPEPEELLDKLERDMRMVNHDVEKWRNQRQALGFVGPRGGLIDWWDIDQRTPFYTWTGAQQYAVFGEGEAGYWIYDPDDAIVDMSLGYLIISSTLTIGYIESEKYTIKHEATLGFRTVIEVSDTVDTIWAVRIGTGDIDESGFGFFANENTLWGVVGRSDAVSDSSIIFETLNPDKRYVLEAYCYPNEKIVYYVNGQVKETIATIYPDSDMKLTGMYFIKDGAPRETLFVYYFQGGVLPG